MNPYGLAFPGLRPFEAEDSYLFFGREEQLQELLKRLRNERFLAIVGPSGCGKSSLVRAGLIPSLKRKGLEGGPRHWNFAILRPGEAPFQRLARELLKSKVLGELETPTPHRLLALHPQGCELAVGYGDSTVRRFDLNVLGEAKPEDFKDRLILPGEQFLRETAGQVSALAYNPSPMCQSGVCPFSGSLREFMEVHA